MRVTDASVFESIRRQVMRARKDVAVAQEQAGTGLRVQKPSDDPVAAAAARRESSRKALAEAGMKSADHAQMQLEGADESLSDVFEGLTRAHELAVEAATTTLSDENRRASASEVRKIREQMVALGNTNVAGRYVFGGFRDQESPFQADGTFVGDTTTKEMQAMPGLKVAASISGSTVFGSADEADNVFATLDSLVEALENNDPEAVRGTLTGLQRNEERVLSARTQVGALLDGVEMARSVADRHAYRAELEIGRLVEVDEISAVTDLLRAKSALESALTVAQQIPVGTLAGGGK
jgi:flagellar hook-associated protein 3 FlgL